MNDRDSLDRGRTTMEAETPASDSRIVPLSELHSYKIASGDPDVRGWPVVAGDGKTIGQVDGLLVDTVALKVRYLDVALGSGEGAVVAEATPSPPENVTADAPVTVGTGIVGTPGLGTYGTVTATGAMAGVTPLVSEPQVREAVAAEDRHVLIPIGSARLAEAEDRIFVESLRSEEVPLLPAYDHGEVTREHEAALLSRFGRSSHDPDDDERFYGARRGRR